MPFKNLSHKDMGTATMVAVGIGIILIFGMIAMLVMDQMKPKFDNEICQNLLMQIEMVRADAPDFSTQIPDNLEWAIFQQRVKDIIRDSRANRCKLDLDAFRTSIGFEPMVK